MLVKGHCLVKKLKIGKCKKRIKRKQRWIAVHVCERDASRTLESGSPHFLSHHYQTIKRLINKQNKQNDKKIIDKEVEEEERLNSLSQKVSNSNNTNSSFGLITLIHWNPKTQLSHTFTSLSLSLSLSFALIFVFNGGSNGEVGNGVGLVNQGRQRPEHGNRPAAAAPRECRHGRGLEEGARQGRPRRRRPPHQRMSRFRHRVRRRQLRHRLRRRQAPRHRSH